MSELTGIHEEEALGKAYDARLMRRLLRYLRPYRRRVVVAVLVLLCGSALELVGPWLTKVAIDRAIPQHDLRLISALALAYAASLALSFLFGYAQIVLTTWLGQRVMFDLRQQIFGHLQRLSLDFFDRNPVGRLMTRVTNDVEVLNDLFSSGVVTVFGDVFTLVFIMGVMLLMNWRLALVTFSVLPMVGIAAFYFRNRIRQAFRDIRIRLARINAYMQERLSGMSVVQLFGREPQVDRRFRGIGDDYLSAQLRAITYYSLFFPVIEVLTAVALALIIGYGGTEILAGGVTVGVIAAFLQYARRFFRPIQDLSEKYNMLQGAMASSERIFTLLDARPSIVPPTRPTPLPSPGRGEIEFRNVWFAYQRRSDATRTAERTDVLATPPMRPDGRTGPDTPRPDDWDWVLRDVSFTARHGERLAIVGHTGAGKTSLISLLMRFYLPQRGEIYFDGVPVSAVDPKELRSRIGLVLQDVFLFSDSIAYNIRLGRGLAETQMAEAAMRVGADRFIDQLPKRYDEPLGERGASLSVGERQLLSFARALAFDPLVLVLDEATSSVDSALEAQIETALETLMRGRTSLVIAHRLSTVQNADRILVLHHGVLREQGTHEELLRRGGLYARLYELQFAQPTAAVS
jgi:ATP-binding cassette, subfamily B, multidrug efflux pump